METLWQDLKYGARMLARNPGFTAVAVLTLALGIGANTAIFSVVDAALLRPLPYNDADRLVHLWETRQREQFAQMEASYPDYVDWVEQNRVFEILGGYNRTSFNLTGGDQPERISAGRATATFFKTLGVEPVLGRAFRPEEERPDNGRVVLLSHGFWERRFGSDPKLVGETITLDGNTYTVIGVLPAGFHFAPARGAELWTPVSLVGRRLERRDMFWLNVVARLKPTVTLQQARVEMSAIAERLARTYPESNSGAGIRVIPLRQEIVGRIQPVLVVLLGAVGFVLLIACANVANLLLARAAGRQKELAIRSALGAGRFRLVRQVLTESVLLAAAGGAAGSLLAVWGMDLLAAAAPASLFPSMPYLQEVGFHRGVFSFTLGLTVLAGVLFGAAPALQGSRPDLNDALKDGGRTGRARSHDRLRHLLVVSEVGLALILLVGTGLMVRSVLRLLAVNPGFNTANLLTLRVYLSSAKYPTRERAANFYGEFLERVERLPGAEAVGATDILPLTGGGNTIWVQAEGQPAPRPGEEFEANIRSVSTDYFRTLGVPLRQGRFFTERDDLNSPMVMIINERVARQLFPNRNPLGQGIVFTSFPEERFDVVGVVGDVRIASLDAQVRPGVYLPGLQSPSYSINLVVRSAGDPLSLLPAIRREVQGLDPELPVHAVRTMDQLIADSAPVFLRRASMQLLSAFAGLALLLALVGIYGVVSYSVAQRSHEMGVRLALGAQARDILGMVVGQGMALTLAGVGIGLVGALALTHLMSSFLFGVTPTDPLTLAVVSVLLVGVSLLACWVPARRATRVDPMVALRYE